jgi:hypothetical protein
MATALNNAFLAAIACLLDGLPTLDELLHAMNRQDALSDGSRFL